MKWNRDRGSYHAIGLRGHYSACHYRWVERPWVLEIRHGSYMSLRIHPTLKAAKAAAEIYDAEETK